MNIIVLAGGISTERDVSIVTGTKVCEALRNAGHRAAILDVYFGTQDMDVFRDDYNVKEAVEAMKANNGLVETTKKTRREFFGENVISLCQQADVVFMALHGENGENGKVQAAFDLFGIKYTGTGHLGSAMAMDKGVSKSIFVANHIPTPQGMTVKKAERENTDMSVITYPCIVKPSCGGSSIGVTIVEKADELDKALEEAFALEDEVVVEDYIKGREFSVGVVDGKAYPIIEIIPKTGFYDYKNKYEAGATDEICPAQLPEDITLEMQRLAVATSEALFLDKYCRVDFLMDAQNHLYCLEANTLPGMTPTSLLPQEAAAIGMSYEQLCEKLIEVSSK